MRFPILAAVFAMSCGSEPIAMTAPPIGPDIAVTLTPSAYPGGGCRLTFEAIADPGTVDIDFALDRDGVAMWSGEFRGVLERSWIAGQGQGRIDYTFRMGAWEDTGFVTSGC